MLNLDTHILIDALVDDLKPGEKKLLSVNPWSISAIVLWEIAKLAQLGRIEISLDDVEVRRVLSGLRIWPITLDVCRAIRKLDFRGDPADEIIAATSLVTGVPLLTRDRVIRRSRVTPLAR
jgi:PIN domain nuclease of toxin-antitoxin system